jgi:Protein of unknown function DUF262
MQIPLNLEETDDSKAVGIEAEDLSSESLDIKSPWDPTSIKVITKTFSLRNLIDLINEDSLDLAPEFQRSQVWNLSQKTQLIESILLQIPLPAFYFAEDADGKMSVIDGVQRLSTIDDFVQGGRDKKSFFLLDGLKYIADVKKMKFSDLPPLWKRRIYNTQIVAHVIGPSTPGPVMFDVFRRINTNGTPLNAQEIRHSVSKLRSREYLKSLVKMSSFDLATDGKLKNQKRMIDREVALRFVAFLKLGPDEYSKTNATMDEFLLQVLREIDNPQILSDRKLDTISMAFDRGLRNAHTVFGEYAFRKWPSDSEAKNPFNRALFEAWTVELSKVEEHIIQMVAQEIALKARKAMAENRDYIGAVTAATGDPRSVYLRFSITAQIIAEAIA